MKTHTLHFEQIGFKPLEYRNLNVQEIRVQIVQLACQYLMDYEYPEFNEADVLGPVSDIVVCWKTGTVSVPIRQVYKPEYLH